MNKTKILQKEEIGLLLLDLCGCVQIFINLSPKIIGYSLTEKYPWSLNILSALMLIILLVFFVIGNTNTPKQRLNKILQNKWLFCITILIIVLSFFSISF